MTTVGYCTVPHHFEGTHVLTVHSSDDLAFYKVICNICKGTFVVPKEQATMLTPPKPGELRMATSSPFLAGELFFITSVQAVNVYYKYCCNAPSLLFGTPNNWTKQMEIVLQFSTVVAQGE